jgi:succinate dehydrogenase / fumarate reductase flavoprotein subunit
VLPLDAPAVQVPVGDVTDRLSKLVGNDGPHGPDYFAAKLGAILDQYASVKRNPAELPVAIQQIRDLRAEFWRDVKVVGEGNRLNQELELAGRVADYLELGELLCIDALDRDESAGAHFRTDHVTPEGEAMRDDERWAVVSAWQAPAGSGSGSGPGSGADADAYAGKPIRNYEPLKFVAVPLQQRNYR